MAKIKYATGVAPFSSERKGFTFQSYHSGKSMLSAKKNDRARYPNQRIKMQYMFHTVKSWREMSPAGRTAWADWVAYFPQQTVKNSAVFLTPYQNFIKRNYYRSLKAGVPSLIFDNPQLVTYDEDDLVITPRLESDSLLIDLEFARDIGDLDVFIFCARAASPGFEYPSSKPRLVASVVSTSQTVDITSAYLAWFGVLPVENDFLVFTSVATGGDNGQFFPRVTQKQQVVSPPPIFEVKLGYLFNYFAVSDARDLIAPGWHCPSISEFQTLSTFLGGNGVSGGKLKETGLTYWLSPNVGASNQSLFTGRGSGLRSNTGTFSNIKHSLYCWTTTPTPAGTNYYAQLFHASDDFFLTGGASFKHGYAVRPVKNSTYLSNGETGTYQGNDGKVYLTICIGSQEWLMGNLAETKYQNGDTIAEVTLAASWAGLTSGARCAYANDPNNV